MINQNQTDIDLVYLWVDGNDPVWRDKRNAFIGKTNEGSPINCKGRYADNDELKYSLRSVEAYAPWIRKIFIVTDNQVPQWLNISHPKIRIVDHKEIMPTESLPCFNSSLIEHFLHKIPGLSEQFLFANDDMYFNKEAKKEHFFTLSGIPIIRLTKKNRSENYVGSGVKNTQETIKNYSRMIARSSELVEKKYGIYYSGMPHHNIDSYLKSDYQRIIEEDFSTEFSANNRNHMRSDNDIHRSIISYIALAENRGRLQYVTSTESMLVRIHKNKDYDKLQKDNPILFCMNDSEYANDNDRTMARNYLENRFPKKSQFEK